MAKYLPSHSQESGDLEIINTPEHMINNDNSAVVYAEEMSDQIIKARDSFQQEVESCVLDINLIIESIKCGTEEIAQLNIDISDKQFILSQSDLTIDSNTFKQLQLEIANLQQLLIRQQKILFEMQTRWVIKATNSIARSSQANELGVILPDKKTKKTVSNELNKQHYTQIMEACDAWWDSRGSLIPKTFWSLIIVLFMHNAKLSMTPKFIPEALLLQIINEIGWITFRKVKADNKTRNLLNPNRQFKLPKFFEY